MPLEDTDNIGGLVPSNPLGIDTTTEGNDHIQLLKNVLKLIFPGVGLQGFAIPIIATEDELNFSTGLTGNIQTQFADLEQSTTDNLTVEILARQNADAALDLRIDGEEIARIAGDDALAFDLGTETGNRVAADGVLQANIDSEAGFRIDGDAALQLQIDSLVNNPTVPVGVIMMFAQIAVPAGWVRDDFAGDNRNLRIVSAVSGNIIGAFGGDASPIDMEQDVSHSHTTGSHQLTINEIPAHQHGYSFRTQQIGVTGGSGFSVDPFFATVQTELIGGSNSHSHGATGSALSTVRFQPRYLNTMLCRKT